MGTQFCPPVLESCIWPTAVWALGLILERFPGGEIRQIETLPNTHIHIHIFFRNILASLIAISLFTVLLQTYYFIKFFLLGYKVNEYNCVFF
jgi:hypothetical protein